MNTIRGTDSIIIVAAIVAMFFGLILGAIETTDVFKESNPAYTGSHSNFNPGRSESNNSKYIYPSTGMIFTGGMAGSIVFFFGTYYGLKGLIWGASRLFPGEGSDSQADDEQDADRP